jgi:hypothetical protein
MALAQYRIRIYEDDNYEVEPDRVYLLALDLDSARGLLHARADLAEVRAAYARFRKLDERAAERVRVSVYTHPEGAYVMDALA